MSKFSKLNFAPICGCCSTVRQYIQRHLDPLMLIRPYSDPQEEYDNLKRSFPDEPLGIDVETLEAYIEELNDHYDELFGDRQHENL